MEGVGARFGRSSTRYGPTSTVFTGPVRKWHKKWVHVAPTSNATTTNNNTASSNHHHLKQSNGSNGNNGSSHLLFYKWAPVGHNGDGKDDVVVEEPRRRKFRYVPVAVLEDNEAAEKETDEKVEDDAKPNGANPDAVEPTPKTVGLDEKPDINDVPMEENQDTDDAPSTRQDLNRNLSFNLNSNDGNPESDINADEK